MKNQGREQPLQGHDLCRSDG